MKTKKLLALLAVLVLLAATLGVTVLAAQEGDVSGASAQKSASVMYTVADGAVTAAELVTASKTAGEVTGQSAAGLNISGTDFSDGVFKLAGDYSIGGKDDLFPVTFEAAPGQTVSDSYNSVISLKADTAGGSKAGAGVTLSSGTAYIDNTYIYAEGNQRYAVSNSGGTMVINDSAVVTKGEVPATASASAPRSNAALLVSGLTRSNMSVGQSQTYYFNSYCVTDGWAAMSTDSAKGTGLDFYAYNSKGIAKTGGYGTYADTNCRVWLYGSLVQGAELGAIISNNGVVHAYSGAQATEDILKYNRGATTQAASELAGGRNVVQIHSPDMFGAGKSSGMQGVFSAENSTIKTTKDLVSTEDYYAAYGDAVGKYVDFISGACVLVKSHSADVDLKNTTVESYSNTILMTVVNSDSMGRFLKAGNTDTPTSLTMEDMTVSGDVKNYDYQRGLEVNLVKTAWTGAADTWDAEQWNAYWQDYASDENCHWILDGAVYTRNSPGTAVSVDAGSKWLVSGPSVINKLTVAEGGSISAAQGDLHIFVDGKEVTGFTSGTLEGAILLTTETTPAALPETKVYFTDVEDGAWYAQYVEALAAQGIINGFDDESYRPDEAVTYGQVLKLICTASGLPVQEATAEHWAGGYLKIIVAAGLLPADTDLNASCPRSVVADVATTLLKLEAAGASPFADTDSVSAAALYEAGVVNGYDENGKVLFKPEAAVKRGEMAKIIYMLLNLTPTEASKTENIVSNSEADALAKSLDVLPADSQSKKLSDNGAISNLHTQTTNKILEAVSGLSRDEIVEMVNSDEIPEELEDIIEWYLEEFQSITADLLPGDDSLQHTKKVVVYYPETETKRTYYEDLDDSVTKKLYALNLESAWAFFSRVLALYYKISIT